jgi:hypothetical protein
MIKINTRKFLALAIALALSAFATFPTFAEAITTTETSIEPYNTSITSCNGEEVDLTGELLLIFHSTYDASGQSHSDFTIVPRQVTGVGSETGTQYRAVGGAREQFNVTTTEVAQHYTFTNIFNLVSQDGSENLLAAITFHLTYNANGEVTATADHGFVSCAA